MQQATFWDGRALKYDEGVRKHDALYTKTIKSARSLLTDSDRVLDLGCGSGEIALDIAPRVRRVHGIDVSEKMIELANRKAESRGVVNVDFRHGDALDQQLPKASFSAVLAFNVFHLVDDIDAVLARIHELLLPGGLLISQTPCLGERSWIFRSLVGVLRIAGLAPPIRSLGFSDIESAVGARGLEVVEAGLWDARDAVERVIARKPSRARSR